MAYMLRDFSFQRGFGGVVTVEVWVTTAHGPQRTSVEVSPEQWASMVAAVSLKGETSETYREALDLHGNGLL